jgi:hypothetical protein
LAAARGAEVVALEGDPASVEACWRSLAAEPGDDDDGSDGDKARLRVLPLVCDLTNPSPASGWASEERMSLIERGPADCVLALALVHHLAIGANVPLPRILDLCARLGSWLVLEWVPKEDPMVARLLSSREDVFVDYSAAALESAAAARFELRRRVPVPGSDRTLYLLRRR